MAEVKSKCKSSNVVSKSIYSLVGGIGLEMLYPPLIPVAMIMKFGGVLGMTYYAWNWTKFIRLFENLKLGVDDIYPKLKSKVCGDKSTVYKFTLPTGLSTDDIKKEQLAMEEHLGKKIKIEYINSGLFIIEVFNSNSQEFYDYEPIKLTGDVPILIGFDVHAKLKSIDLSEIEPHMIIAGNTGCGKSTALRSIITNLILMSSVNLHLIDLKRGVEFSVFSKSDKVKSFSRTIDEAEETLTKILAEIERRYDLFYKYDVNDIKAYNKLFNKNPMPYEVLIVDEMVDLQQKKDILFMLEVIGAKARACGIHMILSTQRPDKDILTGRIKINVGNVLGLKTKDGTNSKIIIDENGLEKLKGKGHAWLLHSGKITELQTPFVNVDRARELIKHTYVEKIIEIKESPKAEIINFDLTDLEIFKI